MALQQRTLKTQEQIEQALQVHLGKSIDRSSQIFGQPWPEDGLHDVVVDQRHLMPDLISQFRSHACAAFAITSAMSSFTDVITPEDRLSPRDMHRQVLAIQADLGVTNIQDRGTLLFDAIARQVGDADSPGVATLQASPWFANGNAYQSEHLQWLKDKAALQQPADGPKYRIKDYAYIPWKITGRDGQAETLASLQVFEALLSRERGPLFPIVFLAHERNEIDPQLPNFAHLADAGMEHVAVIAGYGKIGNFAYLLQHNSKLSNSYFEGNLSPYAVHTNVPRKEVFDNLAEIEVGDGHSRMGIVVITDVERVENK
ncbi:MAG: hypothetical protein R3A45_09790 [Bdellovibrionota bacterium]